MSLITTDRQKTASLRSVVIFFALVFVLCIPLWLAGDNKLPLPVNLPVSALTAFVPMIAAAILVYRQEGINGCRALFGRILDFRKIRGLWWLPVLLLPPLIYILTYLVMQVMGMPLPEEVEVPLATIPAFFALYFMSGVGEELGWTGYATDPLQARWGALRSSILLGLGWAIWHSIAFLQTGNPPDWVLWQCLMTIAIRMLIVWVYNGTSGSVFAAILYHTAGNISWSLFPNYGSHYDPFVANLVIWLVVGAVVVIGRSSQVYETSGRRGHQQRG